MRREPIPVIGPTVAGTIEGCPPSRKPDVKRGGKMR